ncbi:hypothetical protein A2U01_0011784 [Trifolium medium]|uniref:Uncharacterized protein n=1 Tax=Trifolium medium TaxID=97028 RepID=A0A392MTQ0_9FABA|nr:hypothetical protein [Trifolium medium]
MGPKKPTQTKKRKTGASTSGTSRTYDSSKFLGPEQQARFHELSGRTIWPEK